VHNVLTVARGMPNGLPDFVAVAPYTLNYLDNFDTHGSSVAGKVNAGLGIVERFLRLSGCWTSELERYYNRLIEDESEIPRALEPDEQENFLDVAEYNPEWHIVFWYSLLALHTGFSSDELRTLRQGDNQPSPPDHRGESASREKQVAST